MAKVSEGRMLVSEWDPQDSQVPVPQAGFQPSLDLGTRKGESRQTSVNQKAGVERVSTFRPSDGRPVNGIGCTCSAYWPSLLQRQLGTVRPCEEHPPRPAGQGGCGGGWETGWVGWSPLSIGQCWFALLPRLVQVSFIVG